MTSIAEDTNGVLAREIYRNVRDQKKINLIGRRSKLELEKNQLLF